MIIGEPFTNYDAYISIDSDFDSFARRGRRANQGGRVRRKPLRSLANKIRTNAQVRRQNRINNFGLINQAPVVEVRDQDVPDNTSVAQQQPVLLDATDSPQATPDTTATPAINDAGAAPSPEEQAYYSYNKRPKKMNKKKGRTEKSPEQDKKGEEKKPGDKTETTETKEGKDATAASGNDKKPGGTSDTPKGKEENKEEGKTEEKAETKTGITDTKNKKEGSDTLGLIMGFGCLLLTAGIAIYAATAVTNTKKAIMAQHMPGGH